MIKILNARIHKDAHLTKQMAQLEVELIFM
jgi:hypothetical protein